MSAVRVGTEFIARYYFQHFLSEETLGWLARFKELKLSDEEARALVAVREQGAIDNAMYRALNRVDTLAASQSLRRLRDAGLLAQKGRGSATYYEPTARLLGGGAGLSPNLDALSPKFEALSHNLEDLPAKLDALSANLPDLPANLADLPEALRLKLQRLG